MGKMKFYGVRCKGCGSKAVIEAKDMREAMNKYALMKPCGCERGVEAERRERCRSLSGLKVLMSS